MKICITTYYGFRESLESAKNALEKFDNILFSYPLYHKRVEKTCSKNAN